MLDKKTLAKARMLASYLFDYKGEKPLKEFWGDLSFEDKFMVFYKLGAIEKAGENEVLG